MAAPLFILSFRHRDELTRLAESAGWQPIAARRADNAEARFVASGAAIASRRRARRARGGAGGGSGDRRRVEANAAALLVLLSRNDDAALDALHELGATHFLVSPFPDAQLLHALQFALRHAERAGGVFSRRAGEEPGDRAAEGAFWRWQPGTRSVELSPALARKAGLGEADGRRIGLELFRKLDLDRRAARAPSSGSWRPVRRPPSPMPTPMPPAGASPTMSASSRRARSSAAPRRYLADRRRAGSRDPLTGIADGRAARA